MAELNLEKIIKSGVKKALNEPIMDGKSITEWAAIGMKAPRWISVKDRLPENDNEVITAYKIDDEKAMKKRKGKLFVKTGNWTGYRWISVWDEYKSYATEEEVLYWMPLPEPPKEVNVDE